MRVAGVVAVIAGVLLLQVGLFVGREVSVAGESDVASLVDIVSLSVSALTFLVVVATGLLLRRQVRIDQLVSARAQQLELLRIGFERPRLRAVLGPEITGNEDWELGVYRNLWVVHFQMLYLTGATSEEEVRNFFKHEVFANPAGVRWWGQARGVWRLQAQSSDMQAFVDLVDAEFLEAERALPEG